MSTENPTSDQEPSTMHSLKTLFFLGLESHSLEELTDANVRKASLRAVRNSPPERFPDKFKEIRAAYEALQNSQEREDIAFASFSAPPRSEVQEAPIPQTEIQEVPALQAEIQLAPALQAEIQEVPAPPEPKPVEPIEMDLQQQVQAIVELELLGPSTLFTF